jgi:purine catabolism regulator
MRETTRSDPQAAEVAQLAAACRALERQNVILTRLVALYDHLTGLVVQGATIESLARRLARLVGCPVTVLDPLLDPLATAHPPAAEASAPTRRRLPLAAQGRRSRGESVLVPWPPGDARWHPVLTSLREEQRPLRVPALDLQAAVSPASPSPAPLPPGQGEAVRGAHPADVAAWVLAPIAVGGDVLGYLVIAEAEQADGAESLALLGAQHAATVFALVLTRERAQTELAQRLRADLLEALLLAPNADPAALRARAEGLGLDPTQPYTVLVAAPTTRPAGVATLPGSPAPPSEGALHARLLSGLASHASQQAPGVVAVARREEVVVLVPARARGADGRGTALPRPPPRSGQPLAQAVAAELVAHAARRFPAGALTVGIGGPAPTPADLPRAYRQARRALETACRFGRQGRVVSLADLGIYRLLHQVDDPAELADFVQHVLGPLLAYDRAHGAEFVRTLAAYLRHHGSMQLAARELCVHANTVSYRLQRIQTITGLDLTEADDRLAAAVALKLLESGIGEPPAAP